MIYPNEPQTTATVSHHYDSLDAFYRELWGEHIHHGLWITGDEDSAAAVRQLVGHVAREAMVRAGDSVCDVGCGYGATSRMLAGEYGAKVTGVTISRIQYEYALRKIHEAPLPRAGGLSFHLVDWVKNDLSSGAFDAVVAIESTEHMADKAACFSEIFRVLRPGGRGVICAWLAREAPPAWQVRHLLEPICRGGRLPSLGSETDYRRYLEDAGFVIEKFQDSSAQVKKTWSLCVIRFLRNLVIKPSYARFVLDGRNVENIFVGTLFRMWAAFATRALRYGVITVVKPGSG